MAKKVNTKPSAKAKKTASVKAAKPAVKKAEKPTAKKKVVAEKKQKVVKSVKSNVKTIKKDKNKPDTKEMNKPKKVAKETMKKIEKVKSKEKEELKPKSIQVKADKTLKSKTKDQPKRKKDDDDDEENVTLPEDMLLESADVPEPEDIPPPKLTNKEKQKLKALQAKALAKVKAAERERIYAEMLAAAAASFKPVERSKSGRVPYTCEYVIKSSPTILFEFVTTPSGLVQWFADKADINGDEITFNWKGSEESAYILEWLEDERVRYRWEWSEDDEFFQFRIYKNEVTMDTVLEVTDFADEKEIKDQKLLWDSQIKMLVKAIGG
jgi:hypothetical protein